MKSSVPPGCRALASLRAYEWKYSRLPPSAGYNTLALWQSPPSAVEAGGDNRKTEVVWWLETQSISKARSMHLRYVTSFSGSWIRTGKPVDRSKSARSKLRGPRKRGGTEKRRAIENRQLEQFERLSTNGGSKNRLHFEGWRLL